MSQRIDTKRKIIFFGSSEFAVEILSGLLRHQFKIAAVVTQPDKPKGRKGQLFPTPAKEFAQKSGLPVWEFKNLRDAEAFLKIKSAGAEVAVVAAYGQIIPEKVLRLIRCGFINVHPSLLPKYRGPSPIQTAILNGEQKTGVTIMLMDEKMDHGPIIAQRETEILPDDDYPTLATRLSKLGAELLAEVLPDWLAGKIEAKKQDDRKATFTKILTREDGRIDWKHPAEFIVRRVRAFRPWPGTWTVLEGKRIKIVDAVLGFEKIHLLPGVLRITGGKVIVGCGNDSVLEILKIQPEGKKEMSAKEYANGFPEHDGKKFE